MQDMVVFKIVVRLLLPFIVVYALYIQFHGEISAGGGFQAGVILAAAFIAYSLVSDLSALQKIVPEMFLKIMACLGVLLYGGVGVAAMLMGGDFLAYSVFGATTQHGQEIGIFLVEIGVGLVVFSVCMLIFYSFGQRSADGN